MEEENTPPDPIQLRSAKEDLLKNLNDIVGLTYVLAQRDMDKIKKDVEGIVNAIKLQQQHKDIH